MRPATGTLLRRSLALAWIAAFAVGLGGCFWPYGHHRDRDWDRNHSEDHHGNQNGHGHGHGHDDDDD